MLVDFPVQVPRSTEAFWTTNASRSGGTTLGGTQQVVAVPSSLWRAKLGMRLRKTEHFLALRGFLVACQGQANVFYVGPADWRGQPWYRDSLFGDLYTPGVVRRQQPADATVPDTSGALSFVLAANAPAGSTVLSITRQHGGLLAAGQYLQLGDRLHMIVGLASPEIVEDGTGRALPGTVNVNVQPWTRVAYGAGTPVVFDSPRGVMRLQDPEPPAVDMTTSPVGDVTLNLVEAY